jgi:hypothetical protein
MGQFGEMKEVKDLFDLCTEAAELEKFKRSFLNVATTFRNEDRQKAAELFNILPEKLADDRDIQQLRSITVPPKVWGDKSIVIYCGGGTPDAWAYPSIFSGIGGSEEAVIYLSRELAKQGYEVTVYNRCGSMDGEYDGVKYVPYHHFSVRDSFNIIIGWRNPYLFSQSIAAKKKYIWFHDIVQPVHLNDLIINNVNKILFLSEWHSKNVPVPEDKIYITNNGINVDDMTVGEKTGDLIWSSSYDRGLLPFVKNIFPAILKEYPDVKLHVAYGWQNIDKELEKVPALAELKHELAPILENHPNIVHHGRLPHAKLHELMSTCSIYPYASEFGETNNITSQKMQASGVYVVTTAQAGGTPERIIFGDVIDAPEIYRNKESQQKYTQALLKAMKTKHKPKDVSEFDWKVTAQAWVKDLL